MLREICEVLAGCSEEVTPSLSDKILVLESLRWFWKSFLRLYDDASISFSGTNIDFSLLFFRFNF